MKIKKCGFLLSLFMMVCFALPSFAFAESEIEDVIFGAGNSKITDGDRDTYEKLSIKKEISLKLSKPSYNIKNVSIFVNNSSVLDYLYIGFYYKGKFIKTLSYNSLKNEAESVFTFDELVLTNMSKYDLNIYDFKIFSEILIPKDITNLNVVEGVNDVRFTWENPIDSRFTGVKVFFEDRELKLDNSKATEVVSTNLESDKSYKYKFVAMYGDKESKGVEKVVKTKLKPKEPMPLVKPPESVILTPQNGKMVIAWDDVKSPYLEGYNVYIDGKKINNKPLNSNKMIVKNLENEKLYKVQISAVNKENAEGEKSKEVSEKPTSSALEVEYDVKMPFSPLDLLKSSVSLLAIIGGFVLLSIAIIWFRPLKELIVKAVRREKDKK
ncbi:fibronectin type III domain-containing protein [Bacillus wiedmannii]|uniref:fibronectin type III domain-containing protein n=1 Tax=Bacillus wiedmannii TaxID=1890302 RepID=UPI002E2178B0|nr:fibronectin type III domain-containing protein [Bacillus wiedmannii]